MRYRFSLELKYSPHRIWLADCVLYLDRVFWGFVELVDFSMERDFTDKEKERIKKQIGGLLDDEFIKIGLVAFDVQFYDRPNVISEKVKSFWGGYQLEFKIIEKDKFDSYKSDLESLRRNAMPIHQDHSPKFTVDISKYEYVADKRAKDLEGTTVFVYSPEMLAIEKLRALCQQVPKYKDIIISMTPRSRARDFYDIYNLTQSFSIDYTKQENIDLTRHIFDAKRVPIDFYNLLEEQRDFHRGSWDSVLATVDQKEDLKEFDFYFDFVLSQFNHLA